MPLRRGVPSVHSAYGERLAVLAGDALIVMAFQTLGAAQALGQDGEIGHLGAGAMADLVVWDWARGPVAGWRDEVALGRDPTQPAQDLHTRVFAWMTLGDERNVAEVYVAGQARGLTR